jgi:glycosyltransferase involved in cell wall biosynthesis
VKKLAIVATHPVQYNAPWFKLLTERGLIDVKVFYTWSQVEQGPKYDPDFGKVIEWDLPLLEGYENEFVENISKVPGSHHFKGIHTPGLNKAIKSWSPDAVLVIGWAYKSHLACMRYFKNKIPVLFRGDSTLLDETGGFKTFLRRRFLSWVYRYIDVALYAGTNNKKYFRAHGLKEAQLVPAFHAIDNDRFSANDEKLHRQAKELRNSLNIKSNDFVVLFAGKLEEKKNPAFLLELAKRIKGPNIIFLLVGNGHLEERLKENSANDARIKFLPFQNQTAMPAIYTLGNIFILPSKGPGETWGLAVNEAMACGLPVLLSSKTGGAIDLVKENGFIFSLNEIDNVVVFIEKFSNSSELYNKAKQASLNHIKSFSFTRIAEAVEFACGL